MVKIISKEKTGDGRFKVTVDVNGEKKEYSVFTLEQLKSEVRADVEKQNAIDDLDTNLIVGTFDYSETITPPTQAELDRKQFFEDFSKYQRVMEFVDLGLISASNAKVTALKNKVISEFKPEYFNL